MVVSESHACVTSSSRDLRGIDARGREQSDSGVLEVVVKPISA